jgi:hypothetical protein
MPKVSKKALKPIGSRSGGSAFSLVFGSAPMRTALPATPTRRSGAAIPAIFTIAIIRPGAMAALRPSEVIPRHWTAFTLPLVRGSPSGFFLLWKTTCLARSSLLGQAGLRSLRNNLVHRGSDRNWELDRHSRMSGLMGPSADSCACHREAVTWGSPPKGPLYGHCQFWSSGERHIAGWNSG